MRIRPSFSLLCGSPAVAWPPLLEAFAVAEPAAPTSTHKDAQ